MAFTLPAPTGTTSYVALTVPTWANFLGIGSWLNTILGTPVGLPTGFTTPTSSTFTSTAGTITSQTTKNGRLVVVVPSAATQLQSIRIAAPATPYTLDLCAAVNSASAVATDFLAIGLITTDGTKYIMHQAGANAIAADLGNFYSVQRWTNRTTPGATTVATSECLLDPQRIFLRMTNDGTTRSFNVSANGLDYVTIGSETATTFLTETNVGVGFYANTTGSVSPKYALYNWTVSNSVLGDAP